MSRPCLALVLCLAVGCNKSQPAAPSAPSAPTVAVVDAGPPKPPPYEIHWRDTVLTLNEFSVRTKVPAEWPETEFGEGRLYSEPKRVIGANFHTSPRRLD